jgi:hypothetical protein
MTRGLLSTLLAGALLAIAAATAQAAIPFCLPGTGPGQCSGQEGIAVNEVTGDLYVADNAPPPARPPTSAGRGRTGPGKGNPGAR